MGGEPGTRGPNRPGRGMPGRQVGKRRSVRERPPDWEDCSALQSAYTRAARSTLGKTLGSTRGSLLVSASILEQEDALLVGDADRLGP